MKQETLAPFRHKPSLKVRNSYRPRPWDASVEEAKEILRERYRVRGFEVKRVTRRDWHFTVFFGENQEGRGLGPSGLPDITCNWPLINGLSDLDAAIEYVKKRNERVEKAREELKPKEKVIRELPKKRKRRRRRRKK